MKYEFFNDTGSDVKFILEPWADEYLVENGAHISLSMFCEKDRADCSVRNSPSTIVFFAPEHSLVHVFLGGKDVTKASGSVQF